MEQRKLLKAVKAELGGEIDKTLYIRDNAFLCYDCDIDGTFVKLKFISNSEISIDLNYKPPFYMEIHPQNKLIPLLSKFKLFPHFALEIPYYIKFLSEENREQLLTPKLIDLLKELAPFALIKFTHKELRIIKNINSTTTPEEVIKLIQDFLEFGKISSK